MPDITDRLPQLFTAPIMIGVAAPFLLPVIPAAVVAGLTAITFAPGDLAQYYLQIHESFLMMNTAIARVKESPCWPAGETYKWRAFRDSWVAFYSAGPSKWWTLLSGDKARADEFARGLVVWRGKLAKACGQLGVVPVQGPVSNPFQLQPLPSFHWPVADDQEAVANAQLIQDKDLLEQLVRKMDSEVPWGWIGLFGMGLVGLVWWSSRRN